MSALITPDIAQPAPRNLDKELSAISEAYIKNAPKFYELEATYGPQYNRLSLGNLGESLLGYDRGDGTRQPGQLELGRQATEFQRESDIEDVERLGARGTEAYLAANPFLRDSLTALNEQIPESELEIELERQAQEALRSGGQLSPQDERMIEQQTRAAFADHGMTGGNLAVGTELLNRDAAVRGRLSSAQDLARQILGLKQARTDSIGRITQINAGSLSDPFMAVVGRSGGAGATAALSPLNQGRVYSPMDLGAYGQDLFNTNFNQKAAHGIATAQNEAATRAAIASMAGGAMAASDRRLKTNIRKVGKSKSGLTIVEFEYKQATALKLPKGRWRGVIAQEVQELRPDAIAKGADGYLRVRYHLIDVALEEVPPLRVLKEAA